VTVTDAELADLIEATIADVTGRRLVSRPRRGGRHRATRFTWGPADFGACEPSDHSRALSMGALMDRLEGEQCRRVDARAVAHMGWLGGLS